MAKLNRQQLNAIKEKVRQQKAEAAQQKQIEELKLKESGNTQDQEDTTPKTLKDVKALLEKQKQEAAQNGNAKQSKKQQIKQLKREAKGKITPEQRSKVSWNCNIGDLVQIPSDVRIRSTVQEKLDEDSFGIVVKISEDSRSGRRSAIENDSTQAQVLTGGGFRWYYVKSLRTVTKIETN